MKSLSELIPLLSDPKKIVITHHYNPDADALGSSLGLWHFLQKKGHSCTVISPNAIPDFLHWMLGYNQVLIAEQQAGKVANILTETDILFCLDFNQLSRTQTLEPALLKYQGIKVMIDHHLFPDTVFDYGKSVPAKSSTCEMIYDFILECNEAEHIDMATASCLYAGVMTDTGSFKFPCTTAGVHRMVAHLMDLGLKPAPIHHLVFDTFRENRLRFLGYVLSQKMQLYVPTHAALIAVTRDELNKYQIQTGDTEGIVNYPLSIQDIIFSTFISEREDGIRMSFRSKGHFDVNQFARTYFNGGGHANAAGGKSLQSMNDTISLYIAALQENENQLKQCYLESVSV
ncbi:MAG TPA: DHH family phosphoesterase [Chitinophagaceae bacterium]|nr:DHH family phosphoesterase [Chitinophagaceae bacterium]